MERLGLVVAESHGDGLEQVERPGGQALARARLRHHDEPVGLLRLPRPHGCGCRLLTREWLDSLQYGGGEGDNKGKHLLLGVRSAVVVGDSGSGPAGTSSSARLGVLWRWREEYKAGVAACVAAWVWRRVWPRGLLPLVILGTRPDGDRRQPPDPTQL